MQLAILSYLCLDVLLCLEPDEAKVSPFGCKGNRNLAVGGSAVLDGEK